MEHLVIAVDCDDILVETAYDILDHYNATHSTTVSPADFYSDDLEPWGVGHIDEAIERVFERLRTEEHQSIPPLEEAVVALRSLKEQHEIHLVTGRADFLKQSTLSWIDQYFPGVFTSIEFTNFIVPTSQQHATRSKADVAVALAADVFIEDHPHHARIVADAGVQVLLFDYPWNQSIDPSAANITRVKNWQEITEKIKSMSMITTK